MTASRVRSAVPAGQATQNRMIRSSRRNPAMTAPADGQEERHGEKAGHARPGRPRWKTEDTTPPAASTKAVANAAKPNPGLAGSNASGTPRPISSNSANPAPDAVVKKMIER